MMLSYYLAKVTIIYNLILPNGLKRLYISQFPKILIEFTLFLC